MSTDQQHSMRNNNFDLLRLLLAFTVLLVHSYRLSGAVELQFLNDYLSSEAAVQLFFIISGFLIFQSYERSSSLKSYASKRIRRIYPAYFFVILVTSFLCLFIADDEVTAYFSLDWLKYLISNLLFLNFLHPTLPGVFMGNIETAVNGALWTLKIEIMFYISVPVVIYIIRKWGVGRCLLIFYVLSLLYVEFLQFHFGDVSDRWQRQLPGQFSFFIAGAALYYYFDFFHRYALRIFIILGILTLFYQTEVFHILHPVWLATLLFLFVFKLPYLGNFSKYGDLSYGVYIVHFPILQLFIFVGIFDINAYMALFGVSVTVVFIAWMLWHLVEKRFLLR